MKKFIYVVWMAILLTVATEDIVVQMDSTVVMAAKKVKKTNTKATKKSTKKTKKKAKKKKQKKQSNQQRTVNPDAGCIDNPSDILFY